MEIKVIWRAKIGKTYMVFQTKSALGVKRQLPDPTLPTHYTRTSIYRQDTREKVGEAVPVRFEIEWDCATCHYPDYYFGGKYPTDTQHLIVTYFLTFKKESVFRVVWSSETVSPDTHVLGGGSSVGYGYFSA